MRGPCDLCPARLLLDVQCKAATHSWTSCCELSQCFGDGCFGSVATKRCFAMASCFAVPGTNTTYLVRKGCLAKCRLHHEACLMHAVGPWCSVQDMEGGASSDDGET